MAQIAHRRSLARLRQSAGLCERSKRNSRVPRSLARGLQLTGVLLTGRSGLTLVALQGMILTAKLRRKGGTMSLWLRFGVLCGFTVLAIVAGQAQGSGDEAKIRQIVQQVQNAWNAHDGKAFAAVFATDADYVVVNGTYVKGREAIEKGHTQIFATIYKDSRNAATVKSVRFLRPDVAVAHVEWNLEWRVGAEAKKSRALNTMVLTKDAEGWSIAVFQNTPVQGP